jgi:uncharacterized membrane protein
MIPDLVNGTFEFLGGFILLTNVWQIYKDKILKGYNPLATVFFMTWGLWNLYFYPYLGQWYSFAGGVFIVAVNTFWLGQIIYYRRRNA